ncbi:MAG: SpoIIE family protein phosphatase [Clostridia bacterium]|nr:SpoIIE family protein phosphatase [Clostridia bacterium]
MHRGASARFAAGRSASPRGLCLSGTAAAAFALAGIAAGLLFRVGLAYAVIGGGVALSVYNAYTGGLGALLGALPEYAIAGALSIPLLKKISPEKTESEERETERSSEEMVGTMALSFKSRGGGAVSAVISSLSSLSSSARRHFPSSLRPRREELCDLILECAREYCRTCDGASSECICDGGTAELEREAGRIADALYRSGKIRPDELPLSLSCKKREELATTINRAAAILAEKKYKASRGGRADELDLAARLISEAREADEREHALNEHLSGVCGEIITRHGLAGGTARVFGERRPHIIIAAEDERGTKISSSELLRDIESACGTRLGTPEFFRRGRMALLECSAARSFSAECATAGITGSRDEVSGDTSRAFETEDGYFFSLISDGMGSGEEARETSELVGELLSGGLEFGGGKETVMKLLNTLILSRPGECSATVDLFSLDLYRGEACFIKSGAASSYIKRSRAGGGSSLFRIRSHTAPIGLMRDVDAEKIRVEIESDDYIIMLSDGISQNNEDAPWLLELLSQPPKRTVAEYAEFILEGARKNVTPTDDMTVSVTKIIRI